jgi:hypothetical protein
VRAHGVGRRERLRLRHARAQRPVADDHPRQALGRVHELEDPLLLAEPPGEEDVRRVVRLRHPLRDLHSGRNHLDPACAQRSRLVGEEPGRRDDGARAAQQRTHEERRATRQLDVRSPHLQHVRLPRRARGERRRDPVRVNEIGVARDAARGDRVRRDESRNERQLPRSGAQVLRDPAAVGDAEVREGRRRDDVDLDAAFPYRAHRPGDEVARDVPRVARVRRRQDDDLHSVDAAKTIGSASASARNAKK